MTDPTTDELNLLVEHYTRVTVPSSTWADIVRLLNSESPTPEALACLRRRVAGVSLPDVSPRGLKEREKLVQIARERFQDDDFVAVDEDALTDYVTNENGKVIGRYVAAWVWMYEGRHGDPLPTMEQLTEMASEVKQNRETYG